jgi:hypothetical protein
MNEEKGEDGMPLHMRMGLTKDSNGPTDDYEFDHWGCWCGDKDCEEWMDDDQDGR